MPQQSMRFFMFGVLILWVLFLFLMIFHILLVVNYVSKWVEAKATRTNNSKVVVDFVSSKNFCRFDVPRAIISDQGSHLYNRSLASLL